MVVPASRLSFIFVIQCQLRRRGRGAVQPFRNGDTTMRRCNMQTCFLFYSSTAPKRVSDAGWRSIRVFEMTEEGERVLFLRGLRHPRMGIEMDCCADLSLVFAADSGINI
ncbi:hypothetical protein XENOCAPTIV_030528 [Xenoophorus captivus]|uniref:Secreted protein n=1 Tax=Xenoophorus captivus TaxID=1517983 RepID=A0ABV0QXE4_9TELE